MEIESPDLILLDVLMPKMDGFEVFRRIKGNVETHNIPIIFLTVLSPQTPEFKGIGVSARDHIWKPIDLDETTTSVQARL